MRISWLSCAVVLCALCESASADRRINFDWRFSHQEDIKLGGGNVEEAVRAETDDSAWEKVDLPHDFAISGPFGGPSDSGEQGKLPWKGVGIYRKHFDLPVEDEGKRVIFVFGGVRASPRVYLNGREVGSWRYGYNSFHVDATHAANFGGGNVLAVVANAGSQGSRWYPGAGIFRKVTMLVKKQVHVPVWGVYVTTPEVSDAKGTLNVSVEVVNKGDGPSNVSATSTCFSPEGEKVASGKSKSITVGPGKREMLDAAMTVANPQRWDVIHPRLYRVVTTLSVDGAPAETNTVHTGFRTFEVTANDGFILNGRRLQLQGVNLHHDHGPLGAAFFPRAMERQLEIMKEMGVNAIRTSHNMPAPELLDLCDRMGFVVYDEAFDAWSLSFVKNEAEAELRNFVRRDRNHPSVFFWSVGNEVRQKSDGEANRLLRSYVLKHDKTRNVSQGFCTPHLATTEKGILGELDSSGWNYGSRYAEARKNYPDKPLLYTETASAFGTRGAYKLRLPEKKTDYAADGECNAHVLTSARWSDIPEVEFERVLRDKFLLGEFVWTGFDYLGEPTPYNGPQIDRKHGRTGRSSYFGIVDLAGLPKDSYYLYRSHWRPEVTTVYVAPHWNWEGHEATMIPVFGYTNGDEGELFVNGKSMGRQKKEPLKDDLSTGKPAQAGSEDPRLNNLRCDGAAGNAVDDNKLSDWRPAHGEELPQWWMADLQKAQRFNHIRILWASRAEEQEFKVETSMDAVTWEKKEYARRQDHNAECNVTFATITARHVRITVTKGNPAIRDVKVISNIDTYHFRNSIDDYYDVVGKYRLFWDNVPYEPGELKFVAYKGGKVIGEHVRKTAGRPARLRLTADRQQITADGMDLCYVTIEMTDRNGVVCPRAMDDLTFDVEGPARLMGVANGNQMGLDSFTDATHPLFYGKAVAVLRSRPGQSGDVTLKVKTTTGEIRSAIMIRASALPK